jgi:DNA-binding transcriptional LysR family regulator
MNPQMLSFKHLIFLEVARQKNFTKASEVLFLSQPAISKNIQSLESEYQCKLFERHGKKAELTAIGKVLYQKLEKVEAIQEQAEFEMSVLKGELEAKGMLKLGASTTVALYIVPAIISAFHKQYPKVQISLLNRNSNNVLDALLQKIINIGIIEGPKRSKEVTYKPFVSDKVIAVCNAKSKLAKIKTLSIAELPNIPIALREKGSGTLDALIQELSKQDLAITDLQVQVRLGGTEALKNFLLESDALGFLPERAVAKEVKNKELAVIKIVGLEIVRTFYFIERKGESLNSLSKKFMELALSMYNAGL